MPDEWLAESRRTVDARLEELLSLPGSAEPRLAEAMRYSALAPGKRIRPILCMESCRACGGDPADAITPGCATELVHAFSLIHDDLPAIDNDDLRRGRPTCHKAFDEATAILAGDALFALAFQVLAESCPAGVGLLASASGTQGLVAGEMIDVREEQSEPDAAKVERIHRLKTGKLMAAACGIGAMCAGVDPAPLIRFGEAAGLAFQIADDILNETASAEELGKAAGSDRALGKQTYPAALGLEASRAEARRQVDLACQELEGLPGSTDRLADLARYCLDRTR